MVLRPLLLSLVFTFCGSGVVYSLSRKVPMVGYSLSEQGSLVLGPVALGTFLDQLGAETLVISAAVFLLSIGTFSLSTLLSREKSGPARLGLLLLSLLIVPSAACLLAAFQLKHNSYSPGFRRAVSAPFRKFGPSEFAASDF